MANVSKAPSPLAHLRRLVQVFDPIFENVHFSERQLACETATNVGNPTFEPRVPPRASRVLEYGNQASWGLNVLLPPSDKAFNRLLGAPPGAYEAFKKARARRLQARTTPSS